MTVNRDRAQIWYSVTILSDDTQRLYTDESAGINSVSPNGSFGLHSTRRAVPGAFRRKKQMKLILTHLESSNGLESSGKIADEMSSDSRYNSLNSSGYPRRRINTLRCEAPKTTSSYVKLSECLL